MADLKSWREMTTEEKYAAVSARLKLGMSQEQIGLDLGTTKPAIGHFCFRNRLLTRNVRYDWESIIKFLEHGSIAEASQKFGCARGTIENVVRQNRDRVPAKSLPTGGYLPSDKYSGIAAAARKYGITMAECKKRILEAVGREETLCINLLDENA